MLADPELAFVQGDLPVGVILVISHIAAEAHAIIETGPGKRINGDRFFETRYLAPGPVDRHEVHPWRLMSARDRDDDEIAEKGRRRNTCRAREASRQTPFLCPGVSVDSGEQKL